jgi:hypothetical protein
LKPLRDRRQRAIEILKRRLIRAGSPRLQMTGIVLLTGGAGFLASMGLLAIGVQRMAIRYPLAVILAYAAFLLLLRGWLALQRIGVRRRQGWIDGLDIPGGGGSGSGGGGSGSGTFRFGGGSSSGGGAGGSWQAAVPTSSTPAGAGESAGGTWNTAVSSGAHGSGGGGGGGGSGFSLDLDDLLVLLLIVIAIASALAVSAYVIFVSPAPFAELLLEGALATGLYRRLKRVESEYWAVGVVRRTWIPCVIVVLIFSGVGWGLQEIAPEAHSIGDIWRDVGNR